MNRKQQYEAEIAEVSIFIIIIIISSSSSRRRRSRRATAPYLLDTTALFR